MGSDNDVWETRIHGRGMFAGGVEVGQFRGREAVSELYEFELVTALGSARTTSPSDLDEALGRVASLSIGAVGDVQVHGVIREVELLPETEFGEFLVRAVLVPRLWMASLTVVSRAWQNVSVVGIAREVLKSYDLREHDDFDLDRLHARYPELEYVLQYQESDLQFLSRLLEHFGVFYVFEQLGDRERVVFGDTLALFEKLAGHAAVPYDPRWNVTDHVGAVTAIGRRRQVVPRAVVLMDYNWRTPGVDLRARADVSPEGDTVQVAYGEHFKTHSEARQLATIRAEEAARRREVYEARSRVRGMRAGRIFALEDHPTPWLNAEYLVTEVVHSFGWEPDAAGSRAASYENSFVAQSAAVMFRPARSTPRPRIVGLMHGFVDGTADGLAAPVDARGCYRVLLPADIVAHAGGRASRWIRMAQPSSGAGHGVNFPLHIGCEVLLAHLDGDPDRPVIVGAVPNAMTVSPVTAQNATQARIITRGGIDIEFEDQA